MPELTDLTPGSPEWWLAVLEPKLRQRQADTKIYGDYFKGDHKLAFATPKFRTQFGELLADLRDNWTELVVNSIQERLRPVGFRWGLNSEADQDAWDIWQANHLDAEFQIGLTETLVYAECSLLVDPFVEEGEFPRITVEHPHQMIVAFEPGSRWRRLAALKMWQDEMGDWFATVYLPDSIHKFKAAGGVLDSAIILPFGVRFDRWARREIPGETEGVRNPLGVVPVVPVINRPRLIESGVSELSVVIPNQDAVNKLLADMMVASEQAGFRQRWATGIEIPLDDLGNPVEPFNSAVDRLWVNENPESRFGSFDATDLSNYVQAIKSRVESIAAETRVPAHYFGLVGQWPSGEAIKSAEAGLVAKARDKMLFFGEALEEVIRLAFQAMGDARGLDMSAETVWGDPEYRTESEHVDALVKMSSLGVPREALWEKWGASPQEIARWKAMSASEDLLASLAAPEEPVASEPAQLTA